VLLSVLLAEPPGEGSRRHEALTIAAGLATAEAIEEAAGLSCELRWPNDVLVEGAKVAGVLVEMRRHGGRLGVVLGVGINANAAPAPGEVDRPATCLADRLGHQVERVELVRSLLRRLDAWVGRVATGNLEGLHGGFVARCRMINERVTILCDGLAHTGRVLDVDPLGGLILCRDDGSRSTLPADSSTIVA
jgi:BirA family biotin operon repressor/biotin-[acetyl-CoA-carboxylase] ligase